MLLTPNITAKKEFRFFCSLRLRPWDEVSGEDTNLSQLVEGTLGTLTVQPA